MNKQLNLEKQKTRDRLIEEHMYLVNNMVYTKFNYNLASVDREDLIGAGIIGLVEAVDRYDETKGHLKSFLKLRIQGAILDYLRSIDHLKRKSRQQVKLLTQTVQDLEVKLGRLPYDQEVAEVMKISIEKLYEIQRYTSMSFMSMNIAMDESGEEFGSMVADDSSSPEQDTINQVNYQILKETVSQLPEKEKIILGLYYFKQLSMKKIAEALNVSESRICQLHNKALTLLKSKLKNKIS